MKRINILDEHTSNKIAAGEVVERPASVVKELLENSIDAGAKNITIEIEEGGISLIRVIDDGFGIYADDISKAFLPHATSKISCVDDIYNINTLGFRGEALPSIASISEVNFRSKTIDSNFGREVSISAGEILSINDIGMNTGSIMEVRNLFFNVPARKKFLKTVSREGSLVNDIVTRVALSYPDISFKLFNNNKKALLTYGDDNLASTIRIIYGKTIYEDIIEFSNHEDSYIRIYGYIGRESIARGSRNNQSIYVNKRYIKNKTVVAAVENAFKSFSTVNKFPFFVLFIDIPADNIDVNIHPTKAEIKFKDERMIFKVIFDTVHNALKNDVFNSFSIDKNALNENVNIQTPLLINEEPVNNAEKIEQIDLLQTKSNLVNEPSINNIYSSITMSDIKKEEGIYNELKYVKDTKFKQANKENENILKEKYEPCEPENKTINEKPLVTPVAKFADLRIIGQFNKTYIIAEYLDCLYIIDQHAAHEKILFEKYKNDIENKSTIIQPLLIPMVLEMSMDDYECYIENKSLFEKSGFIIDEFGDNTISLKEVPYFLGKLDSKKLFLDMIDNLKNMGSGKTVDVKINKIASMACRAAVKANDYLTEIEMKELVEQLRYIEDPFHCPHGRPIIIKMTNYELDKKFRRIV
ncbi:MAG: DNA mismatch repair endonuclease MutL [Clostridium sp.]|nr:DNA mismatch repair endonuclease MutL [Clostridium sp.]